MGGAKAPSQWPSRLNRTLTPEWTTTHCKVLGKSLDSLSLTTFALDVDFWIHGTS